MYLSKAGAFLVTNWTGPAGSGRLLRCENQL